MTRGVYCRPFYPRQSNRLQGLQALNPDESRSSSLSNDSRARGRSQRDSLAPAQTICGCRPPSVATMGVTGGRRRFRFRSNAGARAVGPTDDDVDVGFAWSERRRWCRRPTARRATGSIDSGGTWRRAAGGPALTILAAYSRAREGRGGDDGAGGRREVGGYARRQSVQPTSLRGFSERAPSFSAGLI
jgi:hypothetical protein